MFVIAIPDTFCLVTTFVTFVEFELVKREVKDGMHHVLAYILVQLLLQATRHSASDNVAAQSNGRCSSGRALALSPALVSAPPSAALFQPLCLLPSPALDAPCSPTA